MISKAIAGYLACDMRPYSTVQNNRFKFMIHTLEPKYTLPSCTYFSETVMHLLFKTVEVRVTSSHEKAVQEYKFNY